MGAGAVALGAAACGSDDDSSESTTTDGADQSTTDTADTSGAGSWQQLTFTDPDYDDQELSYNLFLPAGYDATQSYPLIVFMEDASMVGAEVTTPIDQGEGAVVWASEEWQAEHPTIVVAPQYTEVVVEDDYNPTDYLDITVDLVESLAEEYAVDADRIYNTGQSMGGMMTLGMDVKYRELFAASYVVAAQWEPPEDASVLAAYPMWYTVAAGDEKAYPGMEAIREVVEQHGAAVAGGEISAQASEEEFAEFTDGIVAEGANFNYTVFEAETALGEGAMMEHMGTWDYAYGIAGIREWLFEQRKSS